MSDPHGCLGYPITSWQIFQLACSIDIDALLPQCRVSISHEVYLSAVPDDGGSCVAELVLTWSLVIVPQQKVILEATSSSLSLSPYNEQKWYSRNIY